MDHNQNEFNVYESSKKRKKYFIGAILLVVFIGLGYAFLQTTLNISGTTKVSKNTWEIYWDHLQVMSGSVLTEETGEMAATIDPSNRTEIQFTVNLKQPGDYYEFTVDAVNNGTLDAMIERIDFDVDNGGTLPAYLDYSVTYEDDVPLVAKQVLKAKETNENVETYKVRVEFKKNITSTDLPSNENGETIVCTVNVSYVQADNTSIPRRTDVYSNDNTRFLLNTTIPSGEHTFNISRDAKDTAPYPIFLRHTMVDDIIKMISVGFELDGTDYYLKAGEKFYETNKQIVNGIFDDCKDDSDTVGKATFCSNGDIMVALYDNGIVGVFSESASIDYGCAFRPVDDMAQCGDADLFDEDWPQGD